MVVVEVMGMVVVLLARPAVVNGEDFLAGAGGFCILTVCSRESKLVRAVEAVLEAGLEVGLEAGLEVGLEAGLEVVLALLTCLALDDSPGLKVEALKVIGLDVVLELVFFLLVLNLFLRLLLTDSGLFKVLSCCLVLA